MMNASSIGTATTAINENDRNARVAEALGDAGVGRVRNPVRELP
jgi:hypothetical protein